MNCDEEDYYFLLMLCFIFVRIEFIVFFIDIIKCYIGLIIS